jgi:hypothetical protein
VILCHSVGDDVCFNNGGFGNGYSQNIKCLFMASGCINDTSGDSNSQNLVCIHSTECTNQIFPTDGGNTQRSICVNSATCLKDGTDTKVISVEIIVKS